MPDLCHKPDHLVRLFAISPRESHSPAAPVLPLSGRGSDQARNFQDIAKTRSNGVACASRWMIEPRRLRTHPRTRPLKPVGHPQLARATSTRDLVNIRRPARILPQIAPHHASYCRAQPISTTRRARQNTVARPACPTRLENQRAMWPVPRPRRLDQQRLATPAGTCRHHGSHRQRTARLDGASHCRTMGRPSLLAIQSPQNGASFQAVERTASAAVSGPPPRN